MNAEMLEYFRDAPAAAQEVLIEQQRKMDQMHREMEQMREREERVRMELLMKHCPRWRRGLIRAAWWAYCNAMPKWAS